MRDRQRPTVTSDVRAIIAGNPFASLFKDVKIKLNGVTVTEANSLYPYISQHLLLTKVPPVYRKAVEQSGRIYYDHEDTRAMPKIGEETSQNVGLDPTLWKDLATRQEKYSIGSSYPVDLTLYLFTDLTSAPHPIVIPPMVSVDIELHPNAPSRTIILDKIGVVEPVVEVSKAELIVPRITPAHPVTNKISHQFMRVNAQPIIIPQAATNYNGVVTFSGPVPSRLTLLFASMNSFDGNYADNMYASTPRKVENISFSVGGQHYPATPIAANFPKDLLSEIYLRTSESLRFSLERTQRALPSLDDYASREFMYAIDISSDYSSDSTWTTSPEEGSVAISMHFGAPTRDQMVAILIAETVSTLQISSNGGVSVE